MIKNNRIYFLFTLIIITEVFFHFRMLRNPSLYGIPVDARDDDPKLKQWRANLVHTAATVLEKSSLIKYDRKLGHLQNTELGMIDFCFQLCAIFPFFGGNFLFCFIL